MTDAVQSVRHDWTLAEIKALFELPFNDLVFQAQTAHRANFDPNAVQISTLLSIKPGVIPGALRAIGAVFRAGTGLNAQ